VVIVLLLTNKVRFYLVINFADYICCIFDIQTKKPYVVPETTFKGNSISSTVLSFVRSPGLNQRSEKSATRFQRKLVKNHLEGQSTSVGHI